MSVKYFRSLLYKSSQIQNEIEKEQKRRIPDWMRLLKLKKIRLSIKNKLVKIARDQSRVTLQPIAIKSHDQNKHWRHLH